MRRKKASEKSSIVLCINKQTGHPIVECRWKARLDGDFWVRPFYSETPSSANIAGQFDWSEDGDYMWSGTCSVPSHTQVFVDINGNECSAKDLDYVCISEKEQQEHIQKFREYQRGACDNTVKKLFAKTAAWKAKEDARDVRKAAKKAESVAAPVPSPVPQGETFKNVRIEA